MSKQKAKALAEKLIRAADKEFKKQIKDWRDEKDNDKKKLYAIAALMKKGELKKAANKAEDLDSGIRDFVVPGTVWNFLMLQER